jgi:hypothetical protein
MQGTFSRFSGLLFGFAGLCFLCGWLLIPTSNSIQSLLAHHTQIVWAALFQGLSSLMLVIAVIGLQTEKRSSKSKTMRVGAILTLFGAWGVGLEALFQFLNFALTQVASPANTLAALHLIHTYEIFILAPFLGAFVIGGGVYSAGLYHIDATSVTAKRLFILGLVWGLFGSLWARQTETGWNWVTLGFWAWICMGYCWMGYQIRFHWRPEKALNQEPLRL